VGERLWVVLRLGDGRGSCGSELGGVLLRLARIRSRRSGVTWVYVRFVVCAGWRRVGGLSGMSRRRDVSVGLGGFR